MHTSAVLAGVTKAPELNLDEEEGKQIADSYSRVARHYNWQVNEKAADWYNFAMCVGGIFFAKGMAVKLRRDEERKKNPPPPKPVFTQPERKATPSTPAPAAGPIKAPPPAQHMPPAEPDYSDEMIGA